MMTEKQLEVLRKNQVKKGQILNPTGKNKGTFNRITLETKELLAHAAQHNLPAVNQAIDSLLKSDNEMVRGRAVELYLRLLEFSQPRLSAMAVKGDGVSAGIIVIGKPPELELPAIEASTNDEGNIQDASIIDNNLNTESNGD